MFIVPFRLDEFQYSLVVVLQDDNLERIKAYDPAEVTLKKMPAEWDRLKLKDIIITYATDKEAQQAMQMMERGEGQKALQMLSRGFKFRPERGDHDNLYEVKARR